MSTQHPPHYQQALDIQQFIKGQSVLDGLFSHELLLRACLQIAERADQCSQRLRKESSSSEVMVHIAMIHLMSHRLVAGEK